MYSLLLESYVKDSAEKDPLLSLKPFQFGIPAVARKADWAFRWMNGAQSFVEHLLTFACVEGIFFFGNFCAIVWLKKCGLMLGLTFSNKLIYEEHKQSRARARLSIQSISRTILE